LRESDAFSEAKTLRFETLKSQQERKTRRRRAFYITLISVAALSFFAVVFMFFLKIGKIEISGGSRYSSEEIAAALPIKKGDSLYGFGAESVVTSLKTEFPYIKSVTVTRRIPSAVIIKIVDETPVFYMESGGGYYLLSEDFVVLERLSSPPKDGTGLILLRTGYVKRCVVGQPLSFAETKLLTSLDALWKNLSHYGLAGKINYLEAANRFDIYFGFDSRIRAYIGSVADCDTKIRFFLGIMEHIYKDQSGKIDLSNPKEATFSPESG